jgi:hypothetical protein
MYPSGSGAKGYEMLKRHVLTMLTVFAELYQLRNKEQSAYISGVG